MSIYITVEGTAGSHVDECAMIACRVANRMGMGVFLKFNGAKAYAEKGTKPDDLIAGLEAYKKARPTHAIWQDSE